MNAIDNQITTIESASIDYASFKKAIMNACRIIDKKLVVPELGMILIKATKGGAYVTGTDIDTYTTTFVPGDVSPGFTALIDAHKMKSTMDKVKDAYRINFTCQSDSLTASINKLNLHLKQDVAIDDFPLEASFLEALKETDTSFVVPSATLAKAFTKIQCAISNEKTRYYLNGIFMHVIDGMLTFVATDGHRLGRYQLACPSGAGAMPEKGVIIPSKTALELLRLVKRKECPEDTLITVTDTGISFKVGEDETLSSKIVDGTFPDYVRVIPRDNPNHVAIPTAKMIDAIKQASSIYTAKDCPVSLSLTSGKVVFSVKDPEFGTASVEVITPHDVTLEIGFNGPYLMELASNIEGGTFLELASIVDPVIIRDGADDALTYVLMPIRL